MNIFMQLAIIARKGVRQMTDMELIKLAESQGFSAAVIDVRDVPVDGKFRPFCEENLCGQYNSNYSCPPTCGTVEQMHEKILEGEKALVLKSQWPIESYQDLEGIRMGKSTHNNAMLQLNEVLQKEGYHGLCAGGSCCSLCEPCHMVSGKPCAFPELRFSCMSAYCVDVAQLAKRCGMEFVWDTQMLYIYGMIVLRKA